jgi:hypothetical protein
MLRSATAPTNVVSAPELLAVFGSNVDDVTEAEFDIEPEVPEATLPPMFTVAAFPEEIFPRLQVTVPLAWEHMP